MFDQITSMFDETMGMFDETLVSFDEIFSINEALLGNWIGIIEKWLNRFRRKNVFLGNNSKEKYGNMTNKATQLVIAAVFSF